MEIEVERLHDEVVTLKTAIEQAIREGQKSMDDLNDVAKYGLISNIDSGFTRVSTGLGIVDWVDDF